MITVVLADDHVYIRKAIWYLLETTSDVKVVATASNGKEAIMAARFNHPDVVIMDISMPVIDGLEATRQILEDFRDIRVLMLSGHNDLMHIRHAMEVGASGYVLKESIASEILEAIRSVYSGSRYFSREIAEKADLYIDNDSNSRTISK